MSGMRGTVRRVKKYVGVEATFDAQGAVSPRAVLWDDGRRFEVDRVLDARPAASLKTGGDGIRYTVQVGGKSTYLFFEGDRWFVEARVAEMP